MTPWSTDGPGRPTETQRSRARSLRQRMTEPERRLWRHLRPRFPVAGTHFRRQVPIGPYVADVCCLAARLVVEVDGEQHGSDAQRRHDERRTEVLEGLGYRVLRFANREVMREMEVVLDTIRAALLDKLAATASPVAVRPEAGREVDRPEVETEGGRADGTAPGSSCTTPTPNLSPQGGEECGELNHGGRARTSPNGLAAPSSPLAGEVARLKAETEGGRAGGTAAARSCTTPTPSLSCSLREPQGGEEPVELDEQGRASTTSSLNQLAALPLPCRPTGACGQDRSR